MNRAIEAQTASSTSAQSGSIGEFFAGIYTWMVVGLIVSAIFAYATLYTNLGYSVFSSQAIYYGIVGLEIALLLGVQFMIHKLPVKISLGLFLVYAALNGITLSGLFLMYSLSSVIQIFLVSAAIFGGLALVGYTTKKDLSSWGTVLFAGMIGVFLSSIVNIFLQNSMMDMIVSAVAVVVFCGLTVYDNQIYKGIYAQSQHDDTAQQKYVTLGALHMYVNFIMIFVSLLKLFGSRD